jgi:hypothetical protein
MNGPNKYYMDAVVELHYDYLLPNGEVCQTLYVCFEQLTGARISPSNLWNFLCSTCFELWQLISSRACFSSLCICAYFSIYGCSSEMLNFETVLQCAFFLVARQCANTGNNK